jgi:methylglutaconyl-CoA hydratase
MTSVPDTLVRVSTAPGVTTLTLDSPHNRNALSTALMTQLLAALAEAVTDETVRAVVLSHTGPVFCSGADLKETAAASASGTVPTAMLGEVLAAVWECPKPVVARVGGPARAGGLGLIAAADIAVCAQDATFAFTEVRIGVISRAVPADALDATVAAYCTALSGGAPRALAGVKELLRRPTGDDFRAELADLTTLSTGYFLSEDGREGVLAFREKRPARWVPGA